jgi:WD40 repeat protein
VLAGHKGVVFDVAFSPDGKSVLSAGGDGTIRLSIDDLPDDEAGLRAFLDEAAPGTIPMEHPDPR